MTWPPEGLVDGRFATQEPEDPRFPWFAGGSVDTAREMVEFITDHHLGCRWCQIDKHQGVEIIVV